MHLEGVRRAVDLLLHIVDCLRGPTEFIYGVEIFDGASLDLVGERLSIVRTAERVNGARDTAFRGNYLLGTESELCGLLRGQRERLVESVGV